MQQADRSPTLGHNLQGQPCHQEKPVALRASVAGCTLLLCAVVIGVVEAGLVDAISVRASVGLVPIGSGIGVAACGGLGVNGVGAGSTTERAGVAVLETERVRLARRCTQRRGRALFL